MALINRVLDSEFVKTSRKLTEWGVSFLEQVFRLLTNLTLSGTTAQRPTANLWIGQPYFDTTLGKPIWVKSVGPVVWVDATGAAV